MIFSFFRILLLIQHLVLKAVELNVYLFIYQFFNLNSDLEFMKESHPESLWRLPNRIPIVPGQSSVPLEEKPWKRYLRSIYASLQKEIILISQGCFFAKVKEIIFYSELCSLQCITAFEESNLNSTLEFMYMSKLDYAWHISKLR